MYRTETYSTEERKKGGGVRNADSDMYNRYAI